MDEGHALLGVLDQCRIVQRLASVLHRIVFFNCLDLHHKPPDSSEFQRKERVLKRRFNAALDQCSLTSCGGWDVFGLAFGDEISDLGVKCGVLVFGFWVLGFGFWVLGFGF